ncbi:MAG: DNA adenine methylase [Dehalococcoidales bacterium]|nr:DNA adenine methylase [Dehalococcoidales bacterium]
MPYYTPLRYPGGKRRLTPVLVRLLEENNLKDIQYIEPYAGGASVALTLLIEEYASEIHINDLSRPIFAFWYTILNNTDNICKRIERTKINMAEWYRQRSLFDNQTSADIFELGFATLFLNRTNRSGILSGGVIGGKNQSGTWHLDARFNKSEIIQRIRRISRYKDRINLHQMDALTFIERFPTSSKRNTFIFFDPPYIENGKGLYLNNYTISGHKKMAECIFHVHKPWVCTYDYSAVNYQLFPGYRRIIYGLPYTAQSRYEGKEVMFLSNYLNLPQSWLTQNKPVMLNPEKTKYSLYGILEID